MLSEFLSMAWGMLLCGFCFLWQPHLLLHILLSILPYLSVVLYFYPIVWSPPCVIPLWYAHLQHLITRKPCTLSKQWCWTPPVAFPQGCQAQMKSRMTSPEVCSSVVIQDKISLPTWLQSGYIFVSFSTHQGWTLWLFFEFLMPMYYQLKINLQSLYHGKIRT